jgi:hypothetical protein
MVWRDRVRIWRNKPARRRWYHGVLENRGTRQDLWFVGPILIVWRNKKSAEAMRQARAARRS